MMKNVSGSFTVEAALVLPLILFCILLMLNQGLELYGEMVETAEQQKMWEEFAPADDFRKLELLLKYQDIGGNYGNNI
ncbi:hypothetical protein E5329_11425 [Petralouisia muris]|jgi:hypothetical protein|uniref:Uncharacterized protein n=1 Tax=Petralouisia muris TaxID=3032872 RepID=A0AC61RWC0_9FIRM|nr:hypothetical protein [Petralouisia muris]TGY96075.1 hypothetical protein E5329_11425 [Petralouisia muris]